MPIDTPDNRRIYAKMVARAWTDDSFKKTLVADPTKAARDSGMTLPANAVVKVVDQGQAFTANESSSPPALTILLPARPANLSDEQIMSNKGEPYIGSAGVVCSSSD